MAKRLKSVFTDDLDHCFITGLAPVERHHVFEGRMGNKEKSERYGFIIPLIPRLHPNGAWADSEGRALDVPLKQMAQKYHEEHYGTREDFIREFGKSYL